MYVIGYSESAIHVAAILLNFTDDVDLLTRGDEPEWSEDTTKILENHPIDVIHEEVTGVQNNEDGWLKALEFENRAVREYRRVRDVRHRLQQRAGTKAWLRDQR